MTDPFEVERYWRAEVKEAFPRRKDMGYRRWAKRSVKQLRRSRHYIAWMLGVSPFDRQEYISLWSELRILK